MSQMHKMNNPHQIALRRKELEAELESLDDQEQAWQDLSRAQRLTELIHAFQCSKNHGDYSDHCQFHERSWTNPNGSRSAWHEKVRKFLEALPEDWTDEQVLTVARAVPQ